MKKFASSIFNIVSIGLSVLLYIFLSQPYFAVNASIGTQSGSLELLTGYQVLEEYLDGDSKRVMVAVSLIFLTIFAAFIILCSIVNLLTNFGIIKNKKIYKISNFTNIVSSILMFIFVAVGFFIMIDLTKNLAGGIEGIKGSIDVAWAAILNFIISLGMIFVTLLSYKFNPNGNKKK